MLIYPVSNLISNVYVDDNIDIIFDKYNINKVFTWDGKGGILVYVNLWHKNQYLHRMILEYFGPLHVDHKDRNPFNNQKNNLRIATPTQNCANSGKRSSNWSQFKGVRKRDNKNYYEACITIKGKYIYLGSYKTQKEAALAYDKKALEIHGEFAVLNFPEEVKL